MSLARSHRHRPRLRANYEILDLLEKARRAAALERCGVEPQSAQDAMKLYLNTWVVKPLKKAIATMKGEKP